MKIIKRFLGLFRRPVIRARMEYGGSFIDPDAVKRFAGSNVDRDIDIIYDFVDRHAWAGDFQSIDDMLRLADYYTFNHDILFSWVTTTLCIKDKLKYRQNIVDYLSLKGEDVSGL